ncbi:MAG: sigma-70 family RNA polymerase sigma factor [Pseudomonadota bacterium]
MQGAVSTVVAQSPGPAVQPNRSADDMNALLTRVSSHSDKEAFSKLYAYFAPRVKGYMVRIGASGDQAEDFAQEAMMKVWRKARLYDPAKASASTWIFTIARNVRIDAIRRTAKPALPEDEPALLPPEEPQPDSTVERKQRDQRIRDAFKSLPKNQHDVVTMHFIDDEPHSVIAERLGLPLGTVKSRLRLAFGKIRNEIGDLDE